MNDFPTPGGPCKMMFCFAPNKSTIRSNSGASINKSWRAISLVYLTAGTVGIPFLRISPDHGIGRDIVKKNKASPESLLESIKFFKKIDAKT